MHPKWRITQLSKFVLLGLLIAASAVTARAAGLLGPPIVEEAPGARREIQSEGEIERPDISFIDSPSATCVVPTAGTGQCYIQWNWV
jgi:hypothetical protein